MIECINLEKSLAVPPQKILHHVSLKINDGEFVSISGRSGSGKSTLMYVLSTLDKLSSGELLIDGKNVGLWSVQEIHRFRNLNVGYIFQFHHLLSELTVFENALLPARKYKSQNNYIERAEILLKRLGVLHLSHKFPRELSGGEQQRAAIARALLLRPRYLFADEPTGNLDSYNSKNVMELLKEINLEDKTTICLVTHDPIFSHYAQREIYLIDGRISSRDKES